MFYAPIFLLLFNLIILKSEKVIDNKKQILILGGYAAILIGWILIQGITIEKSNNYVPYWSLPFYIYIVIVLTVYAMGPTIYTSIKIYQDFDDKKMKKKWKFYIIGTTLYFVNALAIGFFNYYNDPILRLIYNTFALSLFCIAYVIYYGVGRQIQKVDPGS